MGHHLAAIVEMNELDAERSKVVDAVFPKHLSSAKECRPHRAVSTWGELDQLDHEMWEAGQFVPIVEQRLSGSFTAPSTREVLYSITLTYCAPSDLRHRVFAIFDAPDAGHAVSRPVKLRFAEAARDHWRFLAVVQRGAAPPHFLVAQTGADGSVANVRELTLRRPFATGATFPSEPPVDCISGAGSSELASCQEYKRQAAARKNEWLEAKPWEVVAELPAPHPNGCTTFYATDNASDAGAFIRLARGDCAMP